MRFRTRESACFFFFPARLARLQENLRQIGAARSVAEAEQSEAQAMERQRNRAKLGLWPTFCACKPRISARKTLRPTSRTRQNTSEKTEYLIITSVSGSTISGEIRTLFRDSSFANERFEGTLQGNSLSFRVIQKDLHPAPGYRIVADIFSGIIDENEDKIASKIERENGSIFITYTKC